MQVFFQDHVVSKLNEKFPLYGRVYIFSKLNEEFPFYGRGNLFHFSMLVGSFIQPTFANSLHFCHVLRPLVFYE